MRRIPFKVLVVVLMGAVLAAPLAAQGWPTPSGAADPPAGCHEGGPIVPIPAPAPSSHQCCQNGHNAATLPVSPASMLSLQVSALVHLPAGTIALAVLHSLPGLALVTGDPPILSPLRV